MSDLDPSEQLKNTPSITQPRDPAQGLNHCSLGDVINLTGDSSGGSDETPTPGHQVFRDEEPSTRSNLEDRTMSDLVQDDETPAPRSGVLLDRDLETAAIDEAAAEQDAFDSACEASSEDPSKTAEKLRLRKIVISLPPATLISPRSVFERSEDAKGSQGFVPGAPRVDELQAIRNLLKAERSQKEEDFIEFELDNFCCYVHTVHYPSEMRGLHGHATRAGEEHFYFDGILRVGDVQHYVRKVRFDQIPLGNYGTGEPTVGDQIWVCSKLNEKRDKYPGQKTDIYYKLKKPVIEYARFHKDFLWVADLAKHVVDFCEYQIANKRNVSIHQFKNKFGKWVRQMHGKSTDFLQWYKQRSTDDFRQSVIANTPFIRKEVYGVFRGKSRHLQLFREIAAPFNLYKRVGNPPKINPAVPRTVVTPYVYECFSHMHLGDLLKPIQPSVGTHEAIKLSWPANTSRYLKFTRGKTAGVCGTPKALLDSIKTGDLISTNPDEKGSGTRWMTESPVKKWFGLVQKVTLKQDCRYFDVIWLYQSDDTPCCKMKYPWENELFAGDHCTCDQSFRSKIRGDDVLDIHSVEWFGSPNTKAEFFVRQTYLTAERRFVTLQKEHLKCEHNGKQEPALEYAFGDTVLVEIPGPTTTLEPYELLGFLDKKVRLRRLRRRREFDADCAPNELVYTEEEMESLTGRIQSRCIVRFYSPGETIPAPYNRNGTGNAFFITHRLLSDGSLQPVGLSKPQLRQGFDPKKQEQKLRALDLFCGCGNFGRGMEDGGAVQARWANDIWEPAIHTYMANAEPDAVNPFLGSIDDLLSHAFEGKFSDSVPRPGQVDVISGGSPCPGFSLLTVDKLTQSQMKNRSLVASFVSCIDFWRPRWGILENVKTIVQSAKNRTQDFFSQLICALVGMGYQTQIILGDAWSHGDPQTRVRAFLYFAAPGVNLPKAPYPSHSNPAKCSGGGLGKITNGEPYVVRFNRPTAFRYVTAAEATADLPDIYDGKTGTCVPFPDHRLSSPVGSGNTWKEDGGQNKRTQILNIPIRPFGMNFSKSWYGIKKKTDRKTDTTGGKADMFDHERAAFPPAEKLRAKPISSAWGRLHPHELFGTVTTCCQIQDARIGGNLMHWDQPRPLSIMEVRRAQGVPDDEVLCGAPADQWEMVGNGVARGISTALGLSLREAWKGSLYEDAGGGSEAGAETSTIEEDNDALYIPWTVEQDDDDGLEDTATAPQDVNYIIIGLTSRGSSHSLCLDAASPLSDTGGSKCSSETPVMSLTTDIIDDSAAPSVMTMNGAGKRERAAHQQPISSKRPRLVESEQTRVVEQDVFQPPLPETRDVEEWPLRTPTSATVVRLSPVESEDEY